MLSGRFDRVYHTHREILQPVNGRPVTILKPRHYLV